jgi:hypothetical protein
MMMKILLRMKKETTNMSYSKHVNPWILV